MAILLAIVAAVFVTVIVMNLSTGEKKIKRTITSLYGTDDPQFVRAMGSLLGPALLPGNEVRQMLNGDEIFPSMLEAIRGAKTSITFETFIFWSGQIGEQFSEALTERARQGVSVHVLLDWVGTGKIDKSYTRSMEKAGVEVERYHPLRWYNVGRLNNRTHRRLLVIDGRIGFTGGVGIADNWLGHAESADHWRDSHFRVEGPVVAEMQSAFMDNWVKTKAEVLHGDRYFPELKPNGNHFAQLFKSSQSEGSESARLMYMLAITSARKSLQIASAYFVPDDLALETIVAARKRGVEIDLIVPGTKIDTEITRKASRSRWGPLLEAGVRIHEYQPTMFHCKVMIVDEIFVSVGSTNFDSRSFRLNDEANLNIYDREFAALPVQAFRDDLTQAREVTFEEWKNRPLREKIVEKAAGLLRSQL